MSQLSPTSRKQIDKGNWPKGVDSFSSPLLDLPGYVRWATDAVNKGGLWQTRPGFKTRLTFTPVTNAPRVNPQGFDWFIPTNDSAWAVWAISGYVWAARLAVDGSFGVPVQLAGVAFNANAQQVTFCHTLQTQTIVNGVVVPCVARNVLIMQDGGSRACYWDGTNSGSLNPQKSVTVDGSGNTKFNAGFNETRIGLWMAWSGNRLFVSLGSQVFASDIGDPLHFTEELTLTSVPSINLPTPVTGMEDRGTSGNVNSQCIIFCRNETYAVYSGVQQRIPNATDGYPGWQGTPNFLSKIFAGTGCVAGKSIVNHRGLIYWLSEGGIVMFDSINNVTSSQNMPAINVEEAYSNVMMSPNQTVACTGFFNSYVFWSVTTGKSNGGIGVNAQTQVLDRQPMPTTPDELFSWQGIWTGINPVSWATMEVLGQTRCYAMSYDADGQIRFYEAFQGNRADNGYPIPWSVETPLHAVSGGIFDRANFLYSRVFMQNIYGNLSMVWRWKGTRGVWHEILTTQVTATPGSILTPVTPYFPLQDGVKIGTFIPQVRDILSRNVRGPQDDCDSSKVEARGLITDGSDRAFAMCYQFRGRGALSAYRIAADDYTQETEGAADAAEIGFHILPGAGCPEFIEGVTPDFVMADDNPNGIIAAFTPAQPQHFATPDDYAVPQAVPQADATNPFNTAIESPCMGDAGGGMCFSNINETGTVFNAAPGSYSVALRVAGVVSQYAGYVNGVQGNGWYVGGDFGAYPGSGNVYRLDISDPPQVFFLNPGASAVSVVEDFTNTITINGGAKILLSQPVGSLTQPDNAGGLVAPNCPNVVQPYSGQFLVVQALSVVKQP